MFITPLFGGCKYTNKFLIINKNIEFQPFEVLITFAKPSFSCSFDARHRMYQGLQFA
jgi:hypothetical protein